MMVIKTISRVITMFTPLLSSLHLSCRLHHSLVVILSYLLITTLLRSSRLFFSPAHIPPLLCFSLITSLSTHLLFSLLLTSLLRLVHL